MEIDMAEEYTVLYPIELLKFTYGSSILTPYPYPNNCRVVARVRNRDYLDGLVIQLTLNLYLSEYSNIP